MPKATIIYEGYIYSFDTATGKLKVVKFDDIPFKLGKITECPEQAMAQLMKALADMPQE